MEWIFYLIFIVFIIAIFFLPAVGFLEGSGILDKIIDYSQRHEKEKERIRQIKNRLHY